MLGIPLPVGVHVARVITLLSVRPLLSHDPISYPDLAVQWLGHGVGHRHQSVEVSPCSERELEVIQCYPLGERVLQLLHYPVQVHRVGTGLVDDVMGRYHGDDASW